MTGTVEFLDAFQHGPDDSFSVWTTALEHSLEAQPDSWLEAVNGAEPLSDARAWTLLSWIETTASEVVRSRRESMLETAAFAIALLEHSRLDQRDRAVAGMLLRRAATLGRLDFPRAVDAGCARAGALGQRCQAWLVDVAGWTPATHDEVAAGPDFAFRRVTAFDASDLERWLEGPQSNR